MIWMRGEGLVIPGDSGRWVCGHGACGQDHKGSESRPGAKDHASCFCCDKHAQECPGKTTRECGRNMKCWVSLCPTLQELPANFLDMTWEVCVCASQPGKVKVTVSGERLLTTLPGTMGQRGPELEGSVPGISGTGLEKPSRSTGVWDAVRTCPEAGVQVLSGQSPGT